MAFYTRTIQIDGVTYKQISPTQWQNLKTGEILDNTKISFIINQFKAKQIPVTPSAGPVGACCEIVNGVMICSEKTQEACSGGCFKGPETSCSVTDENPDPCSTCVHCCFVSVGCVARTPEVCLSGGGTYFGSNGCTACKFGICSSDIVVSERFFGNGCTGVFIEGGGPASLDSGVFCTGSGVGQTCFGPGQRYQNFTPNFIQGGTCSNCILGACCTGGTCAGITSQSACSAISGLFYPGQTCGRCDFGVYCTGSGNNRTCIRTGYQGEQLSNEFQQGATCSYCTMGTCCKQNGDEQVGIRQSNCEGTFFVGIFNTNACDTGSCCVGATCNENVFRYNCTGVFNFGLTCIACSNGACCLPGGGCTLTTMGACMATGGTFFGGATCSACDTGVCCNNGECTDQRRGNFCTGTFYAGTNCSSTPCEQGACCTGGNCVSNTEAINCANLNGEFFRGLTCIACATGANCLTDFEINGDRLCAPNVFFGTVTDGSFYENQGCSACQSGACCNQNGGGVLGIRGDCTSVGTTFFAGQTLYICDTGVFCTGSGVGQTCFGLGYRGQSLSNNFIAGATCNACILGACCTGGTCLSGGLTSQAACSSAGGLFFAGATCRQCDFGVYCTGATCLSLGFRGQSLSNNFIVGATCSSCILGACCTGGTCSGGGQTSQASCNGLFYAGATCRACDFGVYCTGATCFELGYRAQALTNNFIQGATCNSCILGACCTGGTCLGGGQTSQAACSIAGGTFYVGATCFQCDIGVYCTGSGVGQTCFGLGHRGQSLTNNFIAGATCSSCILGACCTGGTCLGGGLTSQAACSSVNGLFYPGTTCVSCDYGVYCTGSNEITSCLGLGYRAQNLSNQFVISGSCLDCVYGSCCQGITCLGITKQANCDRPNSFFAGMTCGACDTGTGACCTGGSSSITTITGCNALGGIFFPEGTTALCVTGSCCTGGTCTQEILGRSGNCQVFVAGATCSICDVGVYCTGATCLQIGFRGQSLTSNFIVGATCNSCILGICCTGGTCIGGGQTAQINCPSSVGSFVAGATQCSACANNVNCCVGGTHSYILAEQCVVLGGIVFEGSEDSLVCESGAFCTGRTCVGVTLFGFNLGNTFIANGDCGDCIYGTCCSDDDEPSDTTQNNCLGTFTPGDYTPIICTAGLTYGICCNGSTCSSDVLEQDCTGYFISDTVAQANSLSCGSNACESGICCGETGVTAATGGICLGLMTRAECALTGGDFFPSYMVSGEATGVTCSNCIYTPMLASVVTEKIGAGLGCASCNNGRTTQFTGVITGFTGNEIQPRRETSDVKSTYLAYRDLVLYGVGGTTSINTLTRVNPIGGSQVIQLIAENFGDTGGAASPPGGTGWKTWFSGATLHTAGITPGSSGFTGSYDYSPAFELGVTTAYGTIMGYIPGEVNNVTLKDVYEVPRYARLVFGYGNPSDDWHNTVLVYRAIAAWKPSNTENFIWSLNDATKHAQLNLNIHNIFPSIMPFQENSTDTEYSSPILVQFFPENPLKYRVRPVGSCCVGATCIGIVTKDHCITRGGTFTENGRCNRCYPNLVFGNCCVGGTHAGYTSLGACNALSGTFFEGTTYDAEACIYGIICTEDRQCFQGISASYYGAFSSTNNKFFVEQEFGSTLGCLACDAGLCCVGATCMGRIPKTQCDALGGSLYYGETTCLTNCDLGICCEIGGACGTYTNRANCYGTNQVFVSGATAGATCSACSSLLTLTSSGSGVTYTMVLNKGTTHGTFHDGSYWVEETPNLKLLKIKMNYTDRENTTSFEYAANTKISGLTLNPSGYKGSVYVHGCAKNPVPLSYIDKDEGVIGDCALARADSNCVDNIDIAKTLQKFTSICYDDYSFGWMGPFGTDSTDIPANYSGFNLQGFLDTMNELKYNGMTLGASDVVMANTSNFDPRNNNVFPSNQTGYPYQIQTSRAQTLAYGILNCLSAADSTLAGSTLCFRPPNTWPKELQKPIYTISSINSKVPGTSGNPLVVLGTSTLDRNLPYKSEVAKTCAQASEFGDGTDYPVSTPVWAMGGARTDTRSYGGQYIGHLRELLRAIHATGPLSSLGTLTFEQRRDGLARIVQYGIDAWGPTKMFCLNLFSGAAQKPGRTRAWIPLAGYYLGVSAMYDPELTLISDTDRTNHFVEYYYSSSPALTPGGTCATTADWRKFAFGDTGPNNNFKGIRKALARAMSHEIVTMVEYINDPSNLVRHYAYPGILYKDTIISGFGTGGQTGITFYNSLRGITYEQAMQADIGVYGNFGTIRWGDGTTSSNPYPTRFGSHFGEGESIEGMWLRVESGPGSSGPNGATASRYYRILYATGFEDGTPPEPANIGGGYQIVIGQTWADGIPNHTSVVKLYPLSVEDVGITRPSTFHPLGYTFGPVGFLINLNPLGCNANNVYTETTLFDAQTASATPYFGTSLYAWADQYLLADYIRKTKGISLISDIAPMPDYLRQFVYTSPYNIKSLYGHFSDTDSVFNTWLGVTWTDLNFAKNQINFAKHFPGIIQWRGLTV